MPTDIDGPLQGLPERKPDIAPDVEAMASRLDNLGSHLSPHQNAAWAYGGASLIRSLAAENARLTDDIDRRAFLAGMRAAAEIAAARYDSVQAIRAAADQLEKEL